MHVCDACHGESPKWQGQCPHCGAWNTLTAQIAPATGRASAARRASLTPTGGASGLAEAMRATPEGSTRTGVGMGELDRVLGGGLVPGSVTLIGGEPGIGKSTLLLQVAQGIAGSPAVLYATGEESVDQVAMRARRLEGAFGHVQVVAQTDLDTILELTARIKPALLIVDSIQTMALASVPSAAGAVTQLRECTAALVRQAKSSATAVVIVGHVTKDGAIAGPRMLEHLVDTVLYFERDAGSRFRRVRAKEPLWRGA